MTEPELRELEKKVNERKKLVERIAAYAEKVLLKNGMQTYYAEHPNNTHTKYELTLGNFFFHGSFGQTSMGGNNINISYKSTRVFSIYYQVRFDECRIDAFVEQASWQKAFAQLMGNTEAAIERANKQRKAGTRKASQEKRNKQKREYLLKEAKRLGLS